MRRRDSFERYYLRNVALGEGCGCAERVIRDPAPPIRAGDTLRAAVTALRTRLRRARGRRAAAGTGRT